MYKVIKGTTVQYYGSLDLAFAVAALYYRVTGKLARVYAI
jgi:hypothetical protein